MPKAYFTTLKSHLSNRIRLKYLKPYVFLKKMEHDSSRLYKASDDILIGCTSHYPKDYLFGELRS